MMMKKGDQNQIRADVLVIGGGGAGLLAAIRARDEGADVLLVSKSRVGYANNTYISKSGLAASKGVRTPLTVLTHTSATRFGAGASSTSDLFSRRSCTKSGPSSHFSRGAGSGS